MTWWMVIHTSATIVYGYICKQYYFEVVVKGLAFAILSGVGHQRREWGVDHATRIASRPVLNANGLHFEQGVYGVWTSSWARVEV